MIALTLIAHSSTLPLKGIGFAKYCFQPLQDRYPTCLIQSKIIVYKRSWHLFPSPTFATCPSPTFHTLDGNVWRGGCFYTRKTGLWFWHVIFSSFLYCHFFFQFFGLACGLTQVTLILYGGLGWWFGSLGNQGFHAIYTIKYELLFAFCFVILNT